MSVVVRDLREGDLAVVHAINQANVPAVGEASLDHLRWLVEESAVSLVSQLGQQVVSYLIALRPGSSYTSPNYTWFVDRYDDFLYVDRVAVDEGARAQGIGGALYDEAERRAVALGAPVLTCEVNVRPMNETSLRFHERRGFEPVGEQETYGGTIRVRLLAKRLDR